MHGTNLTKLINDLAARANAAWQQSVEGIIECGRILIEAKRKVGHGNWLRFVEKLKFSDRTAERLIAIAEHPVLSNPTHVSNLPRSWGTLHRLTSLERSDLEALLKNGTVNSETERAEVDELIARTNKDGLYNYEDVVSALTILSKFMVKWPDLNNDFVAYVCDYIGVFHPDDANTPKLCTWLSKLQEACNEEIQRAQRELDREDNARPESKRIADTPRKQKRSKRAGR